MTTAEPRQMKLGFEHRRQRRACRGLAHAPGAGGCRDGHRAVEADGPGRRSSAAIHFMFWADGIAVRHSAQDEDELRYNARIDVFEPLTLIGALSRRDRADGLRRQRLHHVQRAIHVARKFASLDYVTRGSRRLERRHVLERAGGV